MADLKITSRAGDIRIYINGKPFVPEPTTDWLLQVEDLDLELDEDGRLVVTSEEGF